MTRGTPPGLDGEITLPPCEVCGGIDLILVVTAKGHWVICVDCKRRDGIELGSSREAVERFLARRPMVDEVDVKPIVNRILRQKTLFE